MASRTPHRRPRDRRTALVSVVAVAAAALVVALVVAFRPDGGGAAAATGHTAATAVAGAEQASPSPTPSARKSAFPSPKARTATPSATASTASARASSSPTGAPRAVPASASLAGRIVPGTTRQGVATHYDAADGNGACSFGPSADMMIAAMNTADYETSKACGAYVRVRAASGASVTVRIVNECPGDCAVGQLDLSVQAFARLAAPSTGRIAVSWELVSPAAAGTLSVRYKTGSSQYWCGIQVLGHRNPVARLELRTGNRWLALPRTSYNYFLSEKGSGCGGAVRITDIYGERLTVDGIAVKPNVVQPTRVQFAAH
ncbi:expansin EXLX1 family cellulose-binding protein [Streptomyces sp. SLBN-31]|uniref:expansin EXLX1 family cellulose-binding protein n=1 Tax=Streptomyces sp. SLBN-31 TaxID=2768444 RepID=UPI001153B031|nr:expansin EXLX1 family cellulose-binding protein [Streptomyces sp. SLBN-31]TQJ87941.1 expansin (peptidoglycan-binding protein) [Streptomyces sp. SLBN-31]